MSTASTPDKFMRQALTLAAETLEYGEFPITAVLVLHNAIIATGTGCRQREKRFLGHAELVAPEKADRLSLSFAEREEALPFTTLVPCLMCMGAAMSFLLGEIYYGLESPGDGAVSLVQGWERREEDIPGYRVPRITGGLMREESIQLFEEYVSRQPPGPMRDWAESLTRLR
jgi:tRNA(adenine34) deaminase